MKTGASTQLGTDPEGSEALSVRSNSNYRTKGALEEYCHSMAGSVSSSSLTTVSSKAVQQQPSFNAHTAPTIPAVLVSAEGDEVVDGGAAHADALEYDASDTQPQTSHESFYNMFQ